MAEDAVHLADGVRMEHLRALWDHAPHPVWVHRDLILVYVNAAAVVALGAQTADELIGLSPFNFFAESSRRQVEERISAIRDAGRAAPMVTLTFRRLDDSTFRAQVVAWGISLAGAPAVQASFYDITEIARAEAALAQSERDRAQVIESLPQLVWSTHLDGRPYYYNQRWYDYTGVAKGSTDGAGWIGVLHPEDTERANRTWQTSVETGNPYSIEYRLRRADGMYRWFLARANPLRDAEGRIGQWFGTCTDIDEQRRSQEELREKEERFRTATRAVSDLIWTNDAEGRMRGEQPAWAAFTGQTMEQYQGYGWATAVHPEDAQPSIDAWNVAVAAKKMFVFEHRVRRHDGVYRLFAVRALPVLREDGSIREWVGVHSDITDRRAQMVEIRRLNTELEERVRQRTAELEASNHELEAFSYSVSHDLRAPLRTIDGFSLALEEDAGPLLDAEMRDYIKRIRSGVQRMGKLIDALLQLSRVTRGDIDREPVDLSQLADDAADQAQRAQPEKAVAVQIAPGVRADGDVRLLQVALANLMGNAFKFSSKAEHPSVEFGSQQRNGTTEYFIRDNGAGFDMQYADKLFHAFQRLHGDKDYQGSGIGLATVQRVILRHGGSVRAESSPGRGATFYFTLD